MHHHCCFTLFARLLAQIVTSERISTTSSFITLLWGLKVFVDGVHPRYFRAPPPLNSVERFNPPHTAVPPVPSMSLRHCRVRKRSKHSDRRLRRRTVIKRGGNSCLVVVRCLTSVISRRQCVRRSVVIGLRRALRVRRPAVQCRTIYGRQLPRRLASNAADEWRQFRGGGLCCFCNTSSCYSGYSAAVRRWALCLRFRVFSIASRDVCMDVGGIAVTPRKWPMAGRSCGAFAAAAVRPSLFTVRKICVVKFQLFHNN